MINKYTILFSGIIILLIGCIGYLVGELIFNPFSWYILITYSVYIAMSIIFIFIALLLAVGSYIEDW